MAEVRVSPIRGAADLTAALQRFESIMFAQSGSPEFDEMEVLGAQIREYESRQYPVYPPEPIEAIKEAMSQRGLKPADLQKVIGGGSGRVYEILNRKRPLSLSMIRRLSGELGIPAEILIQPIRLAS
jgi:HTH-type transcriptional regulator / antitoxin HigA